MFATGCQITCGAHKMYLLECRLDSQTAPQQKYYFSEHNCLIITYVSNVLTEDQIIYKAVVKRTRSPKPLLQKLNKEVSKGGTS